MTRPLLTIEELHVAYSRGKKEVPAVRGVTFSIGEGEALGVAGESGSGKSTVGLAVLRLLPPSARVEARRLAFQGRDVLGMDGRTLRSLRGGPIGIVFQDPFASLNPVRTIGEQLEEVLALHAGGRNPQKAVSFLERVHLPTPSEMYRAYPHQLSGGQRQRVCLAMAIAGNPQLLIADEPTTALDVTVQQGILDLLDELRRDLKMALLLISHNIGLLSERTDRLAVMYAGRVVEIGPTVQVLVRPVHPYTQGLLRSLPRLSRKEVRLPALAGQPPDPSDLPSGCPFRTRCGEVLNICSVEDPLLTPPSVGADSLVACHARRITSAASR